jgi:hypothetical protein
MVCKYWTKGRNFRTRYQEHSSAICHNRTTYSGVESLALLHPSVRSEIQHKISDNDEQMYVRGKTARQSLERYSVHYEDPDI